MHSLWGLFLLLHCGRSDAWSSLVVGSQRHRRDSFELLTKPISGSIAKDPISKFLTEAIDFLSKNSKTVVVDQQYFKPDIKDGIAYVIQKKLQKGSKRFDNLRVTRKEYERRFANETLRMASIKNKNVIINKVADQMCAKDYCEFFNQENMHAYYGDASAHLTTEGLKLLEPGYRSIIEKFLST